MKTNDTTETDHALSNGLSWCDSIQEMLGDMARHIANRDNEAQDSCRELIEQSALDVQTRSGWRSPGSKPESDAEYCILLTTGGPACRIVGDLDRGSPQNARMEIQDWGTGWIARGEFTIYEDDLLAFAGHFYFGE